MIRELIHILTHGFWQCVTYPILNYCSLYLLDFTISLFPYSKLFFQGDGSNNTFTQAALLSITLPPLQHDDEMKFLSSFHFFCPLRNSKAVYTLSIETKPGLGTTGLTLSDVEVDL